MKRHLLIAIEAEALTCWHCAHAFELWGHCDLFDKPLDRLPTTTGMIRDGLRSNAKRLPECLAAEAAATTNEQLREMLEQAKRGSAKMAELRDKYGLDDGKEPQR